MQPTGQAVFVTGGLTCTVSFSPRLSNTAARVEKRGLPLRDNVRYRLSRLRCVSWASRPMPRALATSRRANRKVSDPFSDSSPSAAFKYAAASSESWRS